MSRERDDPAVWLVEEFGFEVLGEDAAFIREIGPLVVQYQPEDLPFWSINRMKCDPLTRADITRLCEIFGVEVKQ